MYKKTIQDVDVKGKRVFVRVDFNVPTNKETFEITDDTRITAAVPTIEYLVKEGAMVILGSHKGRPKKEGITENLKMDRVAKCLSEKLDQPVVKLDDCVGEEVEKAVKAMKPGDVVLLENLRFHPEEEKNDPAFAEKLASLAEVYVNDAFGTAHRAHASTEGIAHFLPAVAGLLMEKEIGIMAESLEHPKHPFVAILGGAKISDKIGVIDNLISKVDALLIGGGMAYTFLKAKGYEIGDSLLEEDKIELAKSLMEKAEKQGVKLVLPLDNVIAKEFKNDAEFKTVDSDKIETGWMGLDIGPKTVERFGEVLKDAKLVVWNGPMGVFEMPNFAKGTEAVGRMLAAVNGTTIVGGGDSVAAVNSLGLSDQITHISTGGGASLELMEGKILPGVAILNDK